MELTVLVDNNCYIDKYYLAEPALSFYIEDKELRILFDCGYSDVFYKNAQAMNIDLTKLTEDDVVASGPSIDSLNDTTIFKGLTIYAYNTINNYADTAITSYNISNKFMHHIL